MITGREPVTPHLTYHKMTGIVDGFLEGLTIRQHFAGIAMQGLLSDPDGAKVSAETVKKIIGVNKEANYDYATMYPKYIAMQALSYADALIASLNK